jgi:hypothetical protein
MLISQIDLIMYTSFLFYVFTGQFGSNGNRAPGAPSEFGGNTGNPDRLFVDVFSHLASNQPATALVTSFRIHYLLSSTYSLADHNGRAV